MSNQENYQKILPELEKIGKEDVKTPTMPIDIYTQEAENVYTWCQQDMAALEARGLDRPLIDDIPVRIGALREAQSIWKALQFADGAAEKEWDKQSPLAYELRDQLLDDFRFAYRKDNDLLKRVKAIAGGTGHADMIQDLNDLAKLGKANPAPLEKINLDMTLLDKAAAASSLMASMLAGVERDRRSYSEAIKIRNLAFTYLKQAVDELYDYGKYVFSENEDRRKGYSSSYFRKSRKKNTADKETTEPSPEG